MNCRICERRKREQLYNRYLPLIGAGSIHMLLSAAFFAGIRFLSYDPRKKRLKPDCTETWNEAHKVLTLTSNSNPVSATVHAGSLQVLLMYNGKQHTLKEPEHAGFIVTGRHPPAV